MARSLADGHGKFTILTTKPADPAKPTATELAAGLDISSKVLASDFSWTTADSEKVAENALCTVGNAQGLGLDNYSTKFTLFRYWLAGGGVDPTEDAAFAAVKDKGATLWGYYRKTDKMSTEAWAAGDEIVLGAEFITDWPQDPGAGGFIKFAVPCEVQSGHPWIKVAAGA